ncbi:MAG TPA: hypothetical protein VGL93_11100 [Streptosporangiaceae bacterium]|jgi:hypothetical protein
MSRPEHEHPYDPHLQRPTYLPPEPAPAQAAPPRPPRRRGRFAPLIALVILLPAWLGFLTWRAANQSYAQNSYTVGSVVPRGQPGEFAGATWRLTSIAPAPPPPAGSLTRRPPGGATLVRAYLEVTPHTAAAAKAIYGCSFAGRDDRDRFWDTENSTDTDDGVSDDCSAPGLGARYLPAGRAQKVAVTFLVPTDAARSVRPLVRPTDRAPYVLFE